MRLKYVLLPLNLARGDTFNCPKGETPEQCEKYKMEFAFLGGLTIQLTGKEPITEKRIQEEGSKLKKYFKRTEGYKVGSTDGVELGK